MSVESAVGCDADAAVVATSGTEGVFVTDDALSVAESVYCSGLCAGYLIGEAVH